jgi:hypothetical protein
MAGYLCRSTLKIEKQFTSIFLGFEKKPAFLLGLRLYPPWKSPVFHLTDKNGETDAGCRKDCRVGRPDAGRTRAWLGGIFLELVGDTQSGDGNNASMVIGIYNDLYTTGVWNLQELW